MRNLLLNVAAISLIALVSETVARKVIGLGTPPLYESYNGMEYKMKPNQNILRFGNRIIINDASMRTSSDILNKPKLGKKRVLIFGDSVLWGTSLLDQADIATSILGIKLKEDYEIYNVSAGSWGPGNWNQFIKENGLFNADQIIFLISSHDLNDIPNPLTKINKLMPGENPPFATWELVNRYALPRIQSYLAKIISYNKRQKTINNNSLISEGESILNQSINLVNDSGADFTAVQFWDRREFENESPDKHHSIIKDLFIDRKVNTIQSLPIFKNCSDNASDLFLDHIHLSREGQKCLALVLENAIQR